MRLAASGIGWEHSRDDEALALLAARGFTGVEIAPTMIAGPLPYERTAPAAAYAAHVREAFGFTVCSMQSIWFGKEGSIFGPERDGLLEYTKAAIRFAGAGGIGNLVFGCPKNRVRPEGVSEDDAVPFFRELAEYATAHGTVLALEANPAIYGTNFMNTTAEALAMVEKVGRPGCKLNLDVGTMLVNGEDIELLHGQVGCINHVHISERALAPVERQALHGQLAALLKAEGYEGWVSIEMKQQPLEKLAETAEYVAEVFA